MSVSLRIALGTTAAATAVAVVIVLLPASASSARPGTAWSERTLRQPPAGTEALDGCVRSERRLRPALTRAGAVVRCARLTSATISATARWTTCARWTAARGERCETGSARIAFRSEHVEGDIFGRLRTPPGGRLSHALGAGTVVCTRKRHDPAPGTRGAVPRFEGTVDHLDAVLWPGQDGALRAGVSIVRGGGYSALGGQAPRDPSACYPLRAEGVSPAALTLGAGWSLGDVDGLVRLRTAVDGSSPELGRLVGERRLRLFVQGRTAMTFTVKD